MTLIKLEADKIIVASRENANNLVIPLDGYKPAYNPVLKWAGGKQWLARFAHLLRPKGFAGTYFEPFFGAGSVFFALAPKSATVSDLSKELMSTYAELRDDVEGVAKALSSYKYGKAQYYKIRSSKKRTSRSAAARFLYLNRTCWNGLYRVNQKGEFNVPFGKYKNPTICNRVRLRQASQILQGVAIRTGDFASVVRSAKAGDWVYFDPPYITGHQNNGFLKYNSILFSWEDQLRLSSAVMSLSRRGVYVLVSNADYPQVAKLYGELNQYRVARNSLIGGRGSQRREITESLFSNYPLFVGEKG